MATGVSWKLELAIQEGQGDNLPSLIEEMVSSTRANEPGTLDYQWSTSADGTACHIFERYSDSGAVMVHLANFGEQFAGRFMEILAPTSFVVYGSPNEEVREALAGFNPTYMDSAGGFSR
jgi:quinol monooxygenase YgiN